MKTKILVWIIGIFLLSSLVSATVWDGAYYPFDTNHNDVIYGANFINNTGNIIATHQVGTGSYDYNTASNPQATNLTWRANGKPLQDVKTIDFWIYFVAKGTDRNVMYFSDNSDQNPYIRLWEDGSGNLEIYGSVPNKAMDLVPAGQIITGKWLHVMIVFSNSGTSAYYGYGGNSTLLNPTSADTINMTTDATLDDVFLGRIAGGASAVSNVYIDNLFLSFDKYDSTRATESHNSGLGLDFNGIPPSVSSVDVNLLSPANNITYSVAALNFTYNVTFDGFNLYNCSLYFNNTGSWIINQTDLSPVNNSNNTFLNVPVSQRTYKWGIGCYNGSETIFSVTNRTFIIDTTTPTQTNDFNLYYTQIQTVNINFTDNNEIKNVTIIDNCNFSFTNTSVNKAFYPYSYTYSLAGCGLGTYTTNITYCDYANLCDTDSYNWETLGQINITTKYALDNSTISNFSIYLNGVYNGNTTTGSFLLNNLTGQINISVDATGYALASILYNVTKAADFYNFSLYGSNSLNVVILDEKTGLPVLTNVTITFIGDDGSGWVNVTSIGRLYIQNLNITQYEVQFSSSIYATRTYTITVGDRTTQSLTVYMIQETDSTVFTVLDKDSGEVLADTIFNIYVFNGTGYSLITSTTTDITGKLKLYYNPTGNYQFYLSRANYNDLVFILNPILFETYNIQLEKSISINYSVNLEGIAIIYGPKTFNNTYAATFSFLINSPYGSLTEYGINLTYPGGSSYSIGNNAIGGKLTALVTISNASVFDTVHLDYYYITTLYGRRNISIDLPITFPDGTGENTFMINKDKTYGLGIFERMIIATIMLIFVVGIGSLIGQPIPSFAFGLFIMGYLSYIGFVPLWLILPSMLVGIMFLMWKSGGP